jgi:hypothetical protein
MDARFASEGFSSPGACRAARNTFLRTVGGDFRANLSLTGERDEKR